MNKTVWEKYDEKGRNLISTFGEEYRQFLSKVKTEREFVCEGKKMAEEAGFRDLKFVTGPLKPGDRVYAVNRGKSQSAVRPPLRLPEGRVQGEPPVIVP